MPDPTSSGPTICASRTVLIMLYSQLTKLCNGPNAPELVLIVNPQWETRGNLVSDFGFGQRKADAERFIASFQPTYCIKQLRIYGDSIRCGRVTCAVRIGWMFVFYEHPALWGRK
jgi:hypothetical protein